MSHLRSAIMSSFAELQLNAQLLETLAEIGYNQPTKIQQQAIPEIQEGKDLIAEAQTGTGKTAAFALPILNQLSATPSDEKIRPIRTLILAPTRELAIQVKESFIKYGYQQGVRTIAVFGGVRIDNQIRQLQRGTDVLVATPGRLLDLLSQKALSLSKVETVILDEADRMLDLGFINDIKTLIRKVPNEHQTLLFSATFSSAVESLAKELTSQASWLRADKRNSAAKTVQQIAYGVDNSNKCLALSCMIHGGSWKQVMVFTRTKKRADMVTEFLINEGISAAAIHGDKKQRDRIQALESFKQGKVRILVATDVAARGLDIVALPRVINYDLPNVSEAYVHRIGRTGRAGSNGQAISLVAPDERAYLEQITDLIGRELKLKPLPTLKDGNGDEVYLESALPGKRKRQQQGKASKPSRKPAVKEKIDHQPSTPGIRPSLSAFKAAPKKKR